MSIAVASESGAHVLGHDPENVGPFEGTFFAGEFSVNLDLIAFWFSGPSLMTKSQPGGKALFLWKKHLQFGFDSFGLSPG